MSLDLTPAYLAAEDALVAQNGGAVVRDGVILVVVDPLARVAVDAAVAHLGRAIAADLRCRASSLTLVGKPPTRAAYDWSRAADRVERICGVTP